jgi:redox-regulated HSP33 family molecular chaperone
MSIYEDKLARVCADAESLTGTGGGRALRKIIMDLEGDGPVGEMLHTLDEDRFLRVIDLLMEFRRTGRHEGYNAMHSAARQRIAPQADEG